MTLLEQLQTHKGGLIQLKSQLWWHGGRGWDETPGRVCLLLDAAEAATHRASASAAAMIALPAAAGTTADAFLLIDGQPQWIWLAKEDIELLVNDPPARRDGRSS